MLIALGWIFLLLFLGTGVAGGETGSGGSTPDAGSLDTVVVSNVGQGFSVTSEGSLDPSALASVYPDPAAVTRALSGVAGVVGTYQRSWRTSTSADQVQDLVLRFSSAHAAAAFLRTAQGALATGPIVGTSHVAAVPGARRVAWFGSDGPAGAGVGEAFSLRAGVYVALLSFFSASTDNPRPIAPTNADLIMLAQYVAMEAAPGGRAVATTEPPASGISGADVAWSALAVGALAAAVATPLALRRGHPTTHETSWLVRRSGEDALREQRGHPDGEHGADGD